MHGRVFYLRELRYGFEDDRNQRTRRSVSRSAKRDGRSRISHHHPGVEDLTVVVKLETRAA